MRDRNTARFKIKLEKAQLMLTDDDFQLEIRKKINAADETDFKMVMAIECAIIKKNIG